MLCKGCCGCPMPVVVCSCGFVEGRSSRQGKVSTPGSPTYNLLVVGSRVAQIDVDIPFVARAMVA